MATIKNIIIIGAAGSLGTIALEKLSASKRFNVTVLRRNGSKSSFPAGTKVIEADFSSIESLTSALKGQDAVLSTIASEAIGSQIPIIDAAIAAGVKRFVPSEFGSNVDNPVTRALPVFAPKVKVQEYLLAKAKTTDLTYTFVYNAVFIDWVIKMDFILRTSDRKPQLVNGGESIFSCTSLDTVGDAIVGVFDHPAETKNRAVFIEDMKMSQTKLLALAKQVDPNAAWQTEIVNLDDLIAVADKRLAAGHHDFQTLAPYLQKACFDPACGANFTTLDNELLGLKRKTEEDVLGYFREHLA